MKALLAIAVWFLLIYMPRKLRDAAREQLEAEADDWA